MIIRQLLIALAENHQKEAEQAAKVNQSDQRNHQNPQRQKKSKNKLKDEIVPGG